jgi:BolA-like protein 3
MLCQVCRRALLPRRKPTSLYKIGIPRPIQATRTYATQSIDVPEIRNVTGNLQACLIPSAFGGQVRYFSAVTEKPTSQSDVSPKSPDKPDFLDDAESAIWDRLIAEFEPTELLVRDVSGGCGSMYSIDITSAKFRGSNMLKQQRMVNSVLGDLMKDWHGLQLRTKAPNQ